MKQPDLQTIAANRLAAVADHFGWTPPQLAVILDISQTKAYDALAGRSLITVTMIHTLFTLHNINPNFFFVAKAPMILTKAKSAEEDIHVVSPAAMEEIQAHIAEARNHLQEIKKLL